MNTTVAEKELLQRSSAARFVFGLLLIVAPILMAPGLAAAFPENPQQVFIGAISAYFIGISSVGLSLADLAESKGHSRWYGLLVLLGIIGLIWSVLMPDRNIDRGIEIRRVSFR